MKIRCIKTGKIGQSGSFNTRSLCEILVYFENDMDTDCQKNYEIFIEKEQKWMTFKEAWKGKHIINDNYNTVFFEPENEEDKERGFTL